MSISKDIEKAKRLRLGLNERRLLLIIGDLLLGFSSLIFALYFWSRSIEELGFIDFLIKRPPDLWFFLLPILWIFLLSETYDTHRMFSVRDTLLNIAKAAILGFVIYTVVYFTSTPNSLPRRGIAAFLATASITTLFWRMVFMRIFTAPQFMRRVLIVGAGVTGNALFSEFKSLTSPPFHVIGFIDDNPDLINTENNGNNVFGGSDCLMKTIRKENITDLIVAISGKMHPQMFQVLMDAQEQGIEITRMPQAFERLFGRVPVNYLEADWILRSFVDETRQNQIYTVAKRLIDIIGGLVGVGILFVLYPILSGLIALETGFPVIFRQTRVGKGGQKYTIIKFRTMVQNAEIDGVAVTAVENDTRTTKLGRFLRKSRLDEWPQFINVLRGEMSLVGPRPERPELMQGFQDSIPFYRGRLMGKPGISGWAQVNFGYATTLDEVSTKLEYDLYYIKHRSVLLDTIILLRTFGTILGLGGR